jgi:hypothetical protein
MESCLTEELIKQVFFYSDEKRKDALIADEVDIVGRKKTPPAMGGANVP